MYHLRSYKDLLACEASAIDFASVFIITHSLSARRWCCLAFFARLGANLESLSTNASLNLSALGNSDASDEVATAIFGHLQAAHVPGSISFTMGSSSAAPGNASRGMSTPRKPNGDGFGLTTIRGHSVANMSFEWSSIVGCKREMEFGNT